MRWTYNLPYFVVVYQLHVASNMWLYIPLNLTLDIIQIINASPTQLFIVWMGTIKLFRISFNFRNFFTKHISTFLIPIISTPFNIFYETTFIQYHVTYIRHRQCCLGYGALPYCSCNLSIIDIQCFMVSLFSNL